MSVTSDEKRNDHWHIYFLTTVSQIEQVLVDLIGEQTECQRHQAIMDLPGAEVLVPGFGVWPWQVAPYARLRRVQLGDGWRERGRLDCLPRREPADVTNVLE